MRKPPFIAIFAAAACAFLVGCRTTTPPKPLEMLTAQEQLGRANFEVSCGACHYDRQSGSLHGPSLLGVYKKRYLPSGAPANDDRIRNVILHGRGNMPPLGGSLSDDTITDILIYMKTL